MKNLIMLFVLLSVTLFSSAMAQQRVKAAMTVFVPRSVAEQVAKYADKILTNDKAGRKGLYEKLGRPLDKTVK